LTYSVPTVSESPTSLQSFTEEELMLKETVARFAREVVQPRVRDMDEAELMDKDIIKSMFDNGVSILKL
jgi:short/branched chain acyl-CoA dehydrogenase